MSYSMTKECEGTEDQVSRDTIRSNDNTAVPNCILNKNFSMNSTGKLCDLQGIRDGFIHNRMSTNITDSAARKNSGLLRETKPAGKLPTVIDQRDFFLNGPSLINTNRCKEKALVINRFKKSYPLATIDTTGFCKIPQCLIGRKSPANSTIDLPSKEIINDALIR